jgi:hypothetical protein
MAQVNFKLGKPKTMRDIEAILNLLQIDLNHNMNTLNHENVKRIFTEYCEVQSEDGLTKINGRLFQQYDDSSTLRLQAGYSTVTGAYGYSLYSTLGAETFSVNSSGQIQLSGKPYMQMTDETTTIRLKMGYSTDSDLFEFNMYSSNGDASLSLNSSGEAVFSGDVQTKKDCLVGENLYVGTTDSTGSDYKVIRMQASTGTHAMIIAYESIGPEIEISSLNATSPSSSPTGNLDAFRIKANSVILGSIDSSGSLDCESNITCDGGFGCNGQAAQVASSMSAASSNIDSLKAAISDIRSALLANGIGRT